MFTIWLSMCIMSGTYLWIRRWWLLLFALVILAAVCYGDLERSLECLGLWIEEFAEAARAHVPEYG